MVPESSSVLSPSAFASFYDPIEGDLVRVRRAFERQLRSDLPFVDELCRHVERYRGKMLRPALLLLSGRAAGELTDAHVTLGAVVEMVHLATLVHDDVLDDAGTRRRRPTVNAVKGNEAAVMLGDYLISHAFHLCSTLDSQFASCRIGMATNVVCEGELMQIHHRGDCRLTEAEYFEIIGRKTASLTAVCCELGAHFAGAPGTVAQSLSHFGRHAGIAFQIIDDVLDLVGTEQSMGKTLGRDLDLGKATLPTIHCLSHGDAAIAAQLAAALSNGSAVTAADVRRWLKQSGSIDYAVARAVEHVDLALSQLNPLQSSPAKESLAGLAHFIVRRTQ